MIPADPLVERLRDFGEHAKAHPLCRVMDRADLILEAADQLDAQAGWILRLEDIVRAFRRDALDRLAALSEEVHGYDAS